MIPSLANPILDFKPLRAVMEKTIGVSTKRSLPRYASERFDKWFARHAVAGVVDPGRPSAVNARGYNGTHRVAATEPWPHHPLGRHLRALPRTAYRNRRGKSAGSARVRSSAREKSTMLRTTGIQSGKSRCRRKARKTQCRSFELCRLSTLNSQLSTIGAADSCSSSHRAGRCSWKIIAS